MAMFVNTSLEIFRSSLSLESAYNQYSNSSCLPRLFDVQESCFMGVEESIHNGQIVQIRKNKRILDSGCSRHMIGNPDILNDIIYKDGGLVNFGDNSKGYVIGIGKVGNSEISTITNVLLVKNLKHNLLSISQLCDKGYKIKFEKDKCHIEDNNSTIIFEGVRKKNIYILSMKVSNDTCVCWQIQVTLGFGIRDLGI